jgi:hypothetical protein
LITVTYTVLLNITGELRPRSFLFRSHTKAIQRKMCCQKVRCILIIVISLIITVVILVILCKYKNKIKKIKYHIVEHTTQHRVLKLEASTKTGDEERKKISHVEHIIHYRELKLEERKKTGGEERKKISHVEHIIHYRELKLEERKEKKVIETQEKSIPLTNKCQIIFSSSIYDGCVFK